MPPLSYFKGFRSLLPLLSCVAWSSGLGLPAIALGEPQLLVLQYNPPNRGAPRTRWNAGSRGSCVDLTAVQPTQTNWGTTLLERPTVGIHVTGPAQDLTFELRDEISQEIVYTTVLETIKGPGISLYTLPAEAPALEPDHIYRWRISLDCEQFSTPLAPSEGIRQDAGFIAQEVASEALEKTLAAATADEKPALLAANGLWYDAVHSLLLQRLDQPEDEEWLEDWQTLITHPVVQLQNLMDAQPIDCCLATLDCADENALDSRSLDSRRLESSLPVENLPEGPLPGYVEHLSKV